MSKSTCGNFWISILSTHLSSPTFDTVLEHGLATGYDDTSLVLPAPRRSISLASVPILFAQSARQTRSDQICHIQTRQGTSLGGLTSELRTRNTHQRRIQIQLAPDFPPAPFFKRQDRTAQWRRLVPELPCLPRSRALALPNAQREHAGQNTMTGWPACCAMRYHDVATPARLIGTAHVRPRTRKPRRIIVALD
eukprot:scaffold1130_cov195-Pinguiococcus_pyrenoidosus.AAC.106